MAVVVHEAEEAQLSSTAAQACQHHSHHSDGDCGSVLRIWTKGYEQHAAHRDGGECDDAHIVWDDVHYIGSYEFGGESRDDVGEQHYALGDRRPDEVQRSREDNYVEDIIDEAEKLVSVL